MLCDFGLSKLQSQVDTMDEARRNKVFTGTVSYAPPGEWLYTTVWHACPYFAMLHSAWTGIPYVF